MKSKFIYVIAFVATFAGASAYSQVSKRSTRFGAPSVDGKGNVPTPSVGDILQDTSDGNFYGYSSTGPAWVALSGGANTTLSNLSNPTSISQPLISSADNTVNIGTASNRWANLYVAHIGWDGGNMIIDISNGLMNDSANVRSLDWDAHTTYGNSGGLSVDYGDRALSNASNVTVLNWSGMTAGSAGQFLKTDGSGNASWASVPSPQGTVCGWNDNGTVVSTCQGVDPASSCPTGYTQKTAMSPAQKFCVAN